MEDGIELAPSKKLTRTTSKTPQTEAVTVMDGCS
jgi:hypothetical protein